MASDLTKAVLRAIDAGASSEEFAAIDLPDSYTAVALHAEDAETLGKLPRAEKRPSAAMHVEEVPLPEIAPDEVLVATMASSMNFNTVWSAIFEPVPTFAFLSRYAKVRGHWGKRHDQPFHVVGSDAAGVVLRTGSAVSKWRPGDRVVVHPNDVALEDPQGHDDTILDPDQRVWGFESNYGGLGEVCLAKADQMMPKAEHLTWEEAASMPLTNCTAYRMLVGPNGAPHAAGRRGADLGRGRRPRRLRDAVRAERRRHAGVRRVEPREGRRLPLDGRRPGDRPQGARLPVLGRRRPAGRTRRRRCGSARRSGS